MVDIEKMLKSLEDSLKVTPDNLPLRLYYAQILEENGKNQMALGEYEKVLQKANDSLDARIGMGRIHYRNGNFTEAMEFLEEAVYKNPATAEGRDLLCRAYLGLGNLDKARESYKIAKELDVKYRDEDLENRLFPKEKVPLRMSIDGDKGDMPVEVEKPKLNFNDVGGLEELKENIRLNIIYPFQKPEIYRAYGKKIGGGILLYGPPGCGKTYIARATAGECNARFINVGIEDVLDMWMGESEKKLHNIFEEARGLAPTVIFFDEVEALGRSRSKTGSQPLSVLVNQFLAEMDGIGSRNDELLIMGATNAPWNVDSALKRPGRFDRVIFVPPPDIQARVDILKLKTRGKPVEELDYLKIARTMKKFSGADIDAVYEVASEGALREALRSGNVRKLTTPDFMNAIKKTRPSTVEWLETAKNYATYSNQSGMYNDIIEYLKKEE